MRVIRADEGGTRELNRSYVYRAAYCAVIDEIRKLRRRRETDIEDHAPPVERAPGADPERATNSRRIGEGITGCLEQLAEARRRAVSLYLVGHTVPQVGRMMDWTTKKAENLVYRGLGDLRKCLTKKGLEP